MDRRTPLRAACNAARKKSKCCHYVVCMNKDEDVVDADGKNEEWNDFNDDESGWNVEVAEESNTR